MRHAAVEFARQLQNVDLDQFDGLFTTDMLDLPTLRGLLPAITRLPTTIYFHENQLMYPSRGAANSRQRDMHFAFTNIVSAASADAVWFNSTWHRESFIKAAREWLAKMPDFPPLELVDSIAAKASTQHPGVDLIGSNEDQRHTGPLTIAWVSRWEHDKNPSTFFDSLRLLKQSGTEFQLNVLGESYQRWPECFDVAKREFTAEIQHFGFATDRSQYERLLQQSDVVVSTAIHEFFGLAIVEAVSAGCIPLLPESLAYPEVFSELTGIFHRNSPEHLCEQLVMHADAKRQNADPIDRNNLPQHVSRYAWPAVAKSLDSHILSRQNNA
jgi:glycosyltransferase involved in cell wall biosynthesis